QRRQQVLDGADIDGVACQTGGEIDAAEVFDVCGYFKAAKVGTTETDAEVGRSGLEGERHLFARMKTNPSAGNRSTKCPLCVHQFWMPSAGVPVIKQAGCPHVAFLVTPPKLLRRVDLPDSLRVHLIEGSSLCGHPTTTRPAQVVASLRQHDREILQTLIRSITRVGVPHGSYPDSASHPTRFTTSTRAPPPARFRPPEH